MKHHTCMIIFLCLFGFNVGVVYGQDGEDCSSAIRIDISEEWYVAIDVTTSGRENDIDSLSAQCTGIVATGPDVVFLFDDGNEFGTWISVVWTGDFEAAVYGIEDACDRPCVFGDTGLDIYTSFETGEYQGDPGGHWRCYIVVDGVNGASGSGTLEFYVNLGNPANEHTWGQIKSVYH
ncbi:MAG: hypothetical protein KJ970_03470 [Candidatus Eisenbacteria bacterium]|uniref:Uncharacterized protein n=1 Tax=Eiseniibacteriota bacterium TaxID=2212470 RepID=A0A948RS41_UNCEI|nr:hypothetical protein [Candidatus Eisenbacteria bacterium]MBU1948137.1 hypothetical protein [Candidatus Eisenbacteria bacterium]MBU2689960.1 hypothetical protein [Candidatus Eisenbacteria bacterium]